MRNPLSLGDDRPTSRHVRQNAHLLSDLLNEAIAYLDGDEAAALVTKARRAASAEDVANGDAPVLDSLFSEVSSDQAIFLARALASHSMLANIGEDVAGRRRHAEGDARPGDERPRTLVDAVKALVAEGKSPAELTKVLAAMNVVPVLTAHPTEVRRRSMVDRETEISRLMALRRHNLPADADAEIRERLFREIALMWRTRLYRPERITVKDEIRNALSIVRTSILPAIIDLYADWSLAIGEHGQMAPLLKMGSWLGGDRDGHPGVNGDTLKLALASQARVILDWYAGEVRKLWSNLAVSTAYAPVSEELLALAAQTRDPSVHRLDEPYRLALELVFDRLTAVSQKLTGQPVAYANGTTDVEPYDYPEAFVADLKIIIDSLARNGGERLVGSALRTLVEVAQACGFHLMSPHAGIGGDQLQDCTACDGLARAGFADDPNTSPFRIAKLTSRTAAVCIAVLKSMARFSTRTRSCIASLLPAMLMAGVVASRRSRPSATSDRPIARVQIAMPGKTEIHQAVVGIGLALGDHGAPFGCRRLNAEPENREEPSTMVSTASVITKTAEGNDGVGKGCGTA